MISVRANNKECTYSEEGRLRRGVVRRRRPIPVAAQHAAGTLRGPARLYRARPYAPAQYKFKLTSGRLVVEIQL